MRFFGGPTARKAARAARLEKLRYRRV